MVFVRIFLPQSTPSKTAIHLKSLLNFVQPLKRFVYQSVQLIQTSEQPRIEALIRPRSNSKPRCSSCSKPCPGYDSLDQRRFAFIPLWNIPVVLLYTMRRVNCPRCGIKVEEVPWAEGKHSSCNTFRHFLASWAKRLSWKETAQCFQTSWDKVYRSVQWVVDYGLKQRELNDITALGVDEVAYRKGHHYMTLVLSLIHISEPTRPY